MRPRARRLWASRSDLKTLPCPGITVQMLGVGITSASKSQGARHGPRSVELDSQQEESHADTRSHRSLVV